MSVEFWGGDSVFRIRFHFCGHSVHISEIQVNSTSLQNCPVCGEQSRQGLEVLVRDHVPSPDLAWQAAEQTKARHLQPEASRNVRTSGNMTLVSICGRFDAMI